MERKTIPQLQATAPPVPREGKVNQEYLRELMDRMAKQEKSIQNQQQEKRKEAERYLFGE